MPETAFGKSKMYTWDYAVPYHDSLAMPLNPQICTKYF